MPQNRVQPTILKCPVKSQGNGHCYIINRFCVCYILMLCFCCVVVLLYLIRFPQFYYGIIFINFLIQNFEFFEKTIVMSVTGKSYVDETRVWRTKL